MKSIRNVFQVMASRRMTSRVPVAGASAPTGIARRGSSVNEVGSSSLLAFEMSIG